MDKGDEKKKGEKVKVGEPEVRAKTVEEEDEPPELESRPSVWKPKIPVARGTEAVAAAAAIIDQPGTGGHEEELPPIELHPHETDKDSMLMHYHQVLVFNEMVDKFNLRVPKLVVPDLKKEENKEMDKTNEEMTQLDETEPNVAKCQTCNGLLKVNKKPYRTPLLREHVQHFHPDEYKVTFRIKDEKYCDSCSCSSDEEMTELTFINRQNKVKPGEEKGEEPLSDTSSDTSDEEETKPIKEEVILNNLFDKPEPNVAICKSCNRVVEIKESYYRSPLLWEHVRRFHYDDFLKAPTLLKHVGLSEITKCRLKMGITKEEAAAIIKKREEEKERKLMDERKEKQKQSEILLQIFTKIPPGWITTDFWCSYTNDVHRRCSKYNSCTYERVFGKNKRKQVFPLQDLAMKKILDQFDSHNNTTFDSFVDNLPIMPAIKRKYFGETL